MSWNPVQIGALGRVITGKTPPTGNREFYEGDYPFITPTDLDWQSYFVRNTHSTVTELARDRNQNQFIPANTTVFTCIGNTIGKCGIAAEDSLTNQQINSVIPNQQHDPKFIYYLLNHYRPQIRSIGLGNGAAQPIINKTTFSNVAVSVPSTRDEEERIAAILSAYDDLIENNRRRIVLLEDAARQLYKEWFVRLRFPGHEHTKITNGVPEEWSEHKITDVWDISYGKNLPTSMISEEGAFPVHGADGIIGFYGEKNIEQRICLITCRGAGSGNVRRTFGPTFVTNNCLTLKPKMKADLINFHFAIHAMTELRIQELKTGAAQPQITIAGIGHVLALVPSDALLMAYNVEVDLMFDLADMIRVQNDKLAKARDLLLPRLMNGSLTV